MDTCGYERMQESSADADERQLVIYPMVTYDPETVERRPDISGKNFILNCEVTQRRCHAQSQCLKHYT